MLHELLQLPIINRVHIGGGYYCYTSWLNHHVIGFTVDVSKPHLQCVYVTTCKADLAVLTEVLQRHNSWCHIYTEYSPRRALRLSKYSEWECKIWLHPEATLEALQLVLDDTFKLTSWGYTEPTDYLLENDYEDTAWYY